MSVNDDIIADLAAAIEAIPDMPNLETDSLLDVQGFGAALDFLLAKHAEANGRWQRNARVAVPHWQNHHDETKKRNRK